VLCNYCHHILIPFWIQKCGLSSSCASCRVGQLLGRAGEMYAARQAQPTTLAGVVSNGGVIKAIVTQVLRHACRIHRAGLMDVPPACAVSRAF